MRLKLPSCLLLQSAQSHQWQYNCINSRVSPNSPNRSNMPVIPQYPIPVKKGTRLGAITSPALFSNSVLDAQAKFHPSWILGGINVSLIFLLMTS
jgi:hypothetical protein